MYAVSSFLPEPTLLRVTVGVGSENRSNQNLKFLVKFSGTSVLRTSLLLCERRGWNKCFWAILSSADISSRGTAPFAVGRQEEEKQIRISWKIETQLCCLPGCKLLKHTLKQKLRHLRIHMSNPHLSAAFKHTKDY